MPKTLVHMHPDTLNVVGVWLSPTSSAYLNVPAGAHARTVGEEIMADRGTALSWDEWCDHLAEGWPSVARWQSVECRQGEEPRHVLARSAASRAVARRDAG